MDLTTEQLDYNLFDLSLSLRSLRVRSQQAPDLPPFATIGRVNIDVSLLQLLRGRYVLESGEASGVTVHYLVDTDGRHNVPSPPAQPDQPREPLDYLIAQLRVSDARVRYENRAQDVDAAIPISSITVEGNRLTDRHAIQIAAAHGTLALQERRAALESLNGEVELGQDDLRIGRLEILAEGARISLMGTLAAFENPRADLRLIGTIDAARAFAVAGVDDRVGGTVTVDARAAGPLDRLAIESRVQGSELIFRDLPPFELATTAAYDMGERRARVSSLDVQAPWGRLSASGDVNTQSGPSQLTATISQLDASTLLRAFRAPYVVASRVTARVQAQWPALEYVQATGRATATLTPTRSRPAHSTIPLAGRIEASGREGDITAELTNLTAAGAALDGRIRIQHQQQLGGAVQLHVGDVARVTSAAEIILGSRDALLPMPVAGSIVGTATLNGTVSSPRVTADIDAPALTVGNASGLVVDAGVDYTPAQVRVQQFDVIWGDARAHVEGTIGLDGVRPLDLTLTADAVQVPELLRALEQTDIPAAGALSLDGRVSGTIPQPAAALTLRGTDLSAYNEVWGTLTTRAMLRGRQLTVNELTLDKPQPDGNARVAANGSYDLDRRTYTIDLHSDNVRLTALTLPGGRAIRGSVGLAARGTGSVQQPSGNLDLSIEGLQIDQRDLGRLTLDAQLANQQATVTAAAPTFRVTAKALIGVTAPYPATVHVQVDDLQLGSLPMTLKTPLEGTVTASLDADADLEAPRRGRATATIQTLSGAWSGQPFRLDVPAVLRYVNERVAIDALRLSAQDSTVAVTGELPIAKSDAPGTINVDARANLATLARYAPADTNLTASGALRLTGTVRGTAEAIEPDLSLVVADAAVLTPQIEPGVSNVNVRLHVADGEARLERLEADFGVARLTGTGRIPLEVVPPLPVEIPRRGGPATFTASVQGVDLSQIPGAPADFGGRVSLETSLAADRPDLDALDGRITFPELQLAFGGLTLAQEQTSTISLARGRATLDQFALSGSVGRIAAAGTVGLTGTRSLAVDVDGTLNVAAASVFTAAVRAEGDATLQIAARGSIAAPELKGFIDLADASVVVDEPTIAAEGVAARVDLAGRRVSLTRLTGAVNGGELKGLGFVELGAGGIADAALELITDDVAFDAPLDLRSLSDATVRLSRQGEEFVVNGQVTIEEAGLTSDINFDHGLLAAIGARRRLDLTEKRNPFLERVRFDLNVDTASPVLVDNNLARAEVTADLRVLGTPYEPGLSGRLTVLEESEITLNERRYAVERGIITFLGERDIQPSFDLRLNTSARNYDITVAVSGTPGDTETSLTSAPTLPEPDIMALLVTGRTLEEMRGEEFEVAQEQMLSYLAGRVGSPLGRGLQRATGLSTVRVEPNLIASETEPTARLTLGQELTLALELIYSTDLANSNDQIWVME